MKRYLSTISRSEAQRIVFENTECIKDDELVAVSHSSGRITSRPVFAFISNPPYVLSAMDGYAVDYSQTLAADISKPLQLEKFREAVPVNTGDPLPQGKDAVIMIEEVEEKEQYISIRRPATLWQNVRMVGEDTVEGELLLPKYHKIDSYDIGLLLSCGITHVHVFRKPKLAIIPTGKELVDPYEEGERIKNRGLIIDFNSYVLCSFAQELGFEVKKTKIARSKKEIEELIDSLLDEVDAYLVIAGTSAGREDFTEEIIRKKGEVLFHGVSMMPGKPFLFGKILNKPVFGIPGYPVSAVLCFREFVIPFYEKLLFGDVKREFLAVRMAYKIPSKMGVEELLRVSLIKKGEVFYALPLPRGASLISSLSFADGIVKIPENIEGFLEDEEVVCELIRDRSSLERRITMVGSHDLSLAIIREMVKEINPKMDLVSIPTGSLGGIIAIKKKIADIATTHIFDPEQKTYNLPTLKKYLPETSWRLLNVAKRLIGIAVKKGNPKGIRQLEDIARAGVKFVNRQYGSGTRILFDMLIKEKGIDKEKIDGYDREEPSHTRVGIMIKESVADCGITTYAVAKLFDLEFIPLAEEDFDIVVLEEFTKDERFELLYGIISSEEFKKRLDLLGGYNTEETGKLKYVNR